MSAIASIARQLSQALANSSLDGAWPVMACSTSVARTGATATPPTVTDARVILPPSICSSAAADTMAKSPWRRENSTNAALWPAGQSGMRIVVTISFNSIAGVR